MKICLEEPGCVCVVCCLAAGGFDGISNCSFRGNLTKWRESSPSSRGRPASGGTGGRTGPTSACTPSSPSTPTASRQDTIELCELCDGGVTAGGAPQQVLREEGAVGGAPEDGAGGGGDHHRDVPRVQGQEYQFKIHAEGFSLLKAFSKYCRHRLSECLTMTRVAEGAGRQPESAGQVGGAAVPRGRVKTSQFTAAVGHIKH